MVTSVGEVLSVNKTNSSAQDRIFSFVFSTFLLSAYCIYFLLRINPQLIYQAQQPVFFFDKYYVSEFLKYPGGPIELISGFLSQFFYYSWTGALLLAIVFGLIAWNTKLLFRSIVPDRPVIYMHWVPSIFLLALHSNYRFPLLFTLGLLLALAFTNISIRIVTKNNSLKLLFYTIIHTIIYYFIGGQVYIFSAIIISYEVLYRRRSIQPLLYIIFAGLLPYIGASYLFMMSIKDAYTGHLISYDTYDVTWISYVLYGFFPIVLLLYKFQAKIKQYKKKETKKLKDRLIHSPSIPIRLAQGIVFIILIGIAGFYSYNKNAKAFLRVDYYARFGKWEKLLEMSQKGFPLSNIVQCQFNRALYHTGCLPDRMFILAQLYEGNGLFMREELRTIFPLQHSDVFFDLGLINISEQWAHEAVSANGDTAWNLQRLALVNLLKEKNEIAAKYLKMLQKTLWHRSWAIEHQSYLSDRKEFWANPQYKYIKNIMPKSDFLVSPSEPQLSLEELLNDTNNKMAFEYFMAYCLLDGKISQFMKRINQLNDFDYQKIPRHFEEAILIYNELSGGKGFVPTGKEISKETILMYADFNKIKQKYKGNKLAARLELEKYRDTYWFYGYYYYEP